MYSLLPEEQVKNLQREYHIRVLILLLFCISASIWIGIGSLLPSYIISVVQQTTAENQVKSIEKVTKTSVNAGAVDEVAASNAHILLIKNAQDNVLFSLIIENIANLHPTGIVINDIEIAHAPTTDNPNQTNVAIRGQADTRDHLVAFEHALEGDTEFSSVYLPISALAKSTDIAFSISLAGLH